MRADTLGRAVSCRVVAARGGKGGDAVAAHSEPRRLLLRLDKGLRVALNVSVGAPSS